MMQYKQAIKMKKLLSLLLLISCLSSINAQKLFFIGIQGKLENYEKEDSLTNVTRIALDAVLATLVKDSYIKMYSYRENGDFKNVRKSIDSLDISKDDIVLVYYRGHGGRNPKDESPCPQLLYSGVATDALSADSLTQYFLNKSGRFYMFMYDTSNRETEMLVNKPSLKLKYKPNSSYNNFSYFHGGGKDYYTLNKLFSKKGYVVINAAAIGYDAYSTNGKSILTETISQVFVRPEGNWGNLASQIKMKMKELSSGFPNGEQIPTFIIKINE